jgi:hypothetical protein
MSDEAPPPRKIYGFKPREFERANDAPHAPPPPVPSADPGIATDTSGRIDVRDLARLAAAKSAPLAQKNRAAPANEVHAMLNENLARANAAGLNQVALPPKRLSRRKRDYWLIMLAGNGGLLTVFALFIGFNLYSTMFALFGLTFFSCGVTWIMWHVMDDY